MGYYTINKRLVFMTWDRDKQIKDIAKIGKDSMWAVSSIMRGTQENKNLNEFVYDYLAKEEQRNPKDFENKWVNFYLTNEEAKNNVWDLLYDYCCYYGHARLLNLQTPSEEISSDYSGESFFYPMGKIFAIEHVVRPAKWWWKYLNRMSNRKIRIIINTEEVKEIEGTLDNFIIKTKNVVLICNKDFEINL